MSNVIIYGIRPVSGETFSPDLNEFIFDQDTVSANRNTLQNNRDKTFGGNDSITVAQDSLLIPQGTIKKTQDSVSPKPTFEQIRYWRWLRERKLLVGESRYMKPETEVKVVSSVIVEKENLGLPIRERNFVNTDWITLLLILGLIIIASVRGIYAKYLGYLFQSLINYSTSYRMFRERGYTILHGAFRLEALFYLMLSILFYQVIQNYGLILSHEKMSNFISIFGITTGYFLVKKIVYSAVGLILEGDSETKEYLFNMDNFNRILGIVLFPVVALINYYPTENPLILATTGIFVVLFFYVLVLQRGIFILMKKQFSIFYLFLYLCTLEFLPLLLIYKVVVL